MSEIDVPGEGGSQVTDDLTTSTIPGATEPDGSGSTRVGAPHETRPEPRSDTRKDTRNDAPGRHGPSPNGRPMPWPTGPTRPLPVHPGRSDGTHPSRPDAALAERSDRTERTTVVHRPTIPAAREGNHRAAVNADSRAGAGAGPVRTWRLVAEPTRPR